MIKSFLVVCVFSYSMIASALTVFIGGAGSHIRNFEPYWAKTPGEVVFFDPDTKPLSANHARDLEALKKLVSARTEVSIVAYSVGGKFGYKLATELPENVFKQLLLLDPVGGPPPQRKPSQKFPVWLDDSLSDAIASKTTIIASDPQLSKHLGFSFTDGEYGPAKYRSSLRKASYLLFSGTSHTSFLFPPLTWGARLFCKRGDEAAEVKLRNAVVEKCRNI